MRSPALIGAFTAILVLCSPAAASSPPSRPCPPASVVSSKLGVHVGNPVPSRTPFSETCTYPVANKLYSPSITFQEDTAAQFAADEKATQKMLGASVTNVKVHGDPGWTTGTGDLYLWDGKEQIKIHALGLGVTSPKTATAKVEALALTLL